MRVGAQNVELRGRQQGDRLARGRGRESRWSGRNELFADLSRSVGPSSAGVVVARDQLRLRWTRDITPRLSLLAGLRGTHDEDLEDTDLALFSRAFLRHRRRRSAVALAGGVLAARRPTTTPGRNSTTRWMMPPRAAPWFPFSINPCNVDAKGTIDNGLQASPEFSDYVHAIARRKALLIGIAIPIAVLAILLSLTLARHLHLVGAGGNRRAVERAVGWRTTSGGDSYADQYVQNLKGIVLTDSQPAQAQQGARPVPGPRG